MWIDSPFQREELLGARVGPAELLGGRLDLVRQVIRPANSESRVYHLARPHAHGFTFRRLDSLLVVHDEREGLCFRPGEQGARILLGVTDRHVENVGAMTREDARHLRDELIEALDRNEVLLQHVS